MEMTMEERCRNIVNDCLGSKEVNPVKIFYKLAGKSYIRIHGPEHHILDGACVMTAFYNAGGSVDLKKGLERLMEEGLKMPGATCGLWGVCGSVSSVGAALAIIEETGPLSQDQTFGMHMVCTSNALQKNVSNRRTKMLQKACIYRYERGGYVPESKVFPIYAI